MPSNVLKITAVFAEESRRLLMQYALPKKNLYPADRKLASSVISPDCFGYGTCGSGLVAGIDDNPRLNPVWHLDVLVLREDGSKAILDPKITVDETASSGGTLNECRFIKTDIPLGEGVRLLITHEAALKTKTPDP